MCLLSLAVSATVPSLTPRVSVKQADGTTLSLLRCRTNQLVYYVTTDGLAVLETSPGVYEYAETNDNGTLTATGILAHDPAQREVGETFRASLEKDVVLNHAEKFKTEFSTKQNFMDPLAYSQSGDGLCVYGQSLNEAGRGIGTVHSQDSTRIPVLLVEFSDLKMKETTTIKAVQDMLTKEGYSDSFGSVGSVRDYFISQSQGMFDPKFEVLAKITMDESYAYWGKDGEDGSLDVNTKAFVQKAIEKAQDAGVDFKQYIKNEKTFYGQQGYGDYGVPLVCIMYAGQGEHRMTDSDAANHFWPHFSAYYNNVGNVKIKGYFIGNETVKPNAWTENLEGIGVFTHEFGHALGIPDWYNTAGESQTAHTPSYWSVMDSGSYNGNGGYAPVGYTAYERILCGWQNYRVLNSNVPEQVKLYSYLDPNKPADADVALVMRNPNLRTEYYVLENRQYKFGDWYPATMGAGMLVNHIDFNYNSWQQVTVNNTLTRYRNDIIPADGTWQSTPGWGGYKGDLFPGSKKITQLTDTSTPQAAVCNMGTKLMSQPLLNISMTDGVVSFDYMEDFTAINTPVKAEKTVSGTYDLQGRRVNDVKNGIYIIDGKKVVK